MDHDKARDDNAENLPPAHQIRNEETGETEQDALFQYRSNNEQFHSDEESDESFRNVSSDNSSPIEKLWCGNIDHAILCPKFNEHSDSILSLYNCCGKNSCIPDNDGQIQQQENQGTNSQIPQQEKEDFTTKIHEINLNDESSLISNQKNLENLEPAASNAFKKRSQENKRSPAQSAKSYYSELSDFCTRYLESAEREQISPLSPQPSTSQQADFISHLANADSSNWMCFKARDPGTYSMIPSPISSRYINSENKQSSQPRPNSSTSHGTETHLSETKPLLTSLLRRHNSPSTLFEAPHEIVRRNLSRCWERIDTPSHDVNSEKENQQSNPLSLCSSVRNANDECNSTNSSILAERLFRSWEEPSASTHGTSERKERQNEGTSCSSEIRMKNASSFPDLPSTSKIPPKRTSPHFLQYTQSFKSARKLNFDSGTSSDTSEEKISTLTGTTVRKLGKKNELRKKRKTSHLSQSSENCSTLPKTGDTNVSGNVYPLFKNPNKKSSEPKKSESVRSVGSSETMNFKILETNTSSRKRLISGNKTSDSDETRSKKKKRQMKSKKKEKQKQSESSEEESN